jgi:hypothetical protein
VIRGWQHHGRRNPLMLVIPILGRTLTPVRRKS